VHAVPPSTIYPRWGGASAVVTILGVAQQALELS